jgi:hypothetical protein
MCRVNIPLWDGGWAGGMLPGGDFHEKYETMLEKRFDIERVEHYL